MFIRQFRSNTWANLADHALEEANPTHTETTATRPTTPDRRHSNTTYCSSFRISCCTLLACARALIPVWLSTWNFARSLVA
jgi:hypothetical protein